MTSIQRVVSIGAHSLDAELMGGPLILKYARQCAHCTLIHVTQGAAGGSRAATEEAKQAYLKDLLTMNQKAAEKLGADTIWARLCFQQYAFAGRLRPADGTVFRR